MATYTLISSNVLASSAASVTFSSIPADYTDLVVRLSARTTFGSYVDGIYLRFNGSSATDYSATGLETTNGTSVGSYRLSNNNYLGISMYQSASTATSNTFGNAEYYIPSYLASQNKPTCGFGVGENNATAAAVGVEAGLWRSSSAITSLTVYGNNGSFVSGSSFYLYGISNA